MLWKTDSVAPVVTYICATWNIDDNLDLFLVAKPKTSETISEKEWRTSERFKINYRLVNSPAFAERTLSKRSKVLDK